MDKGGRLFGDSFFWMLEFGLLSNASAEKGEDFTSAFCGVTLFLRTERSTVNSEFIFGFEDFSDLDKFKIPSLSGCLLKFGCNIGGGGGGALYSTFEVELKSRTDSVLLGFELCPPVDFDATSLAFCSSDFGLP